MFRTVRWKQQHSRVEHKQFEITIHFLLRWRVKWRWWYYRSKPAFKLQSIRTKVVYLRGFSSGLVFLAFFLHFLALFAAFFCNVWSGLTDIWCLANYIFTIKMRMKKSFQPTLVLRRWPGLLIRSISVSVTLLFQLLQLFNWP